MLPRIIIYRGVNWLIIFNSIGPVSKHRGKGKRYSANMAKSQSVTVGNTVVKVRHTLP